MKFTCNLCRLAQCACTPCGLLPSPVYCPSPDDMLAQQSLHCRHLGASSTQARRSIRVSAFGGFLPRLLMQQAGQHTDSKLSRTEVQLQTAGGDLQYPFRVCTFNVLVGATSGSAKEGLSPLFGRHCGAVGCVPYKCTQACAHILPIWFHTPALPT